MGQRKRQNEMGKTLSRPSTSSVGNGNNFKIAKWYSLGIKIKEKGYREQNHGISFSSKKPKRIFFSLYQVPKQRKMKEDSKFSGKLFCLIITHSSKQLFLMLIILL